MSKNTGEFGPPERVYVENEWYDGPRAGVADIDGAPHHFKSLFDEAEDDYLGAFVVWPIDAVTLELEIRVECPVRIREVEARISPGA